MDAEPYGAAETALAALSILLKDFCPSWFCVLAVPPLPEGVRGRLTCPGRCGAKCVFTQIGPMPGPPPPCGIAKVLCKFKWHTSAPIKPGAVIPTCAFMLAPSI